MKWPLVPLQRVVLVNPKDDDHKGLSDDTPVSFVSMSAVSENGFGITERIVKPLGDVRRGCSAFKNNDVLFAKITPCMENGKSAVATGLENARGFGSTEFHVLRAGSTLLPDFLHYFLRQKSFRLLARQHMRGGAGQQRVPSDFLQKEAIPLPPLSEQRRIVEVLDQADRLRRLRMEAGAKAERILPALFIRMFGDPGTNPKRLPIIELGSVIIEGPQNGLYKPESSYGEGTQILRIDGFYGGKISGLDSLKRIRASSEEIEKYGLQESDIVVNRFNSEEYLGKSAIIPALSEPLLFEPNMMRLAVDKSQVLPEFVLAHLQTSFTKTEILSKAKRAINQASINQQDVKSLKILRPSSEDQERFVAAYNRFQKMSDRYTEKRTRLENLFDSLLQRSFSGDLTASWRGAKTATTSESVELAGDRN